jgi:hypothetical protein
MILYLFACLPIYHQPSVHSSRNPNFGNRERTRQPGSGRCHYLADSPVEIFSSLVAISICQHAIGLFEDYLVVLDSRMDLR